MSRLTPDHYLRNVEVLRKFESPHTQAFTEPFLLLKAGMGAFRTGDAEAAMDLLHKIPGTLPSLHGIMLRRFEAVVDEIAGAPPNFGEVEQREYDITEEYLLDTPAEAIIMELARDGRLFEVHNLESTVSLVHPAVSFPICEAYHRQLGTVLTSPVFEILKSFCEETDSSSNLLDENSQLVFELLNIHFGSIKSDIALRPLS